MIDGHAHLNEIENIENAVKRAKAAGVQGIVAVGMDMESNVKTLALAGLFPSYVHPAAGYHPWSITPEGIEENLAFIEANIGSCVAVGEVGLDYGAKAKKKVQQEVFGRILNIAGRNDKPVIIHTRYSHKRALQMAREALIERCVFHWYSGPADVLDGVLGSGYFISATPALTYSPAHRVAISMAPLEQILIETDSPVAYQGKKSEPADLVITLEELSRIKNMPPGEVASITVSNTVAFYRNFLT